MSSPDPIFGSITAAKDILDAGNTLVTLLIQLKGKLLGRKDRAAQALGDVLEEINKSYMNVDEALNQYLSVQFNPNLPLYDQFNVEAREKLLRLERHQLRAQMQQARTRCSRIELIYDTYLRGWFDQVFGPSPEKKELRNALIDLWGNDARIVDDLNGLANWLSNEAKTTLDLVDKNDFKSANARILETRGKVLPFSGGVSRIMAELRRLQGDFDQAAGAISP
jgi:hypothetical protein